jgi:hypothetical protein
VADIAVQLGEALRDRYAKVLHPELAATLGPERFLGEIRLTARLDHPHILPVFDSGEAAGRAVSASDGRGPRGDGVPGT